MDDPDLNSPVKIKGRTDTKKFVANEEAVLAIQGMGFTAPQAKLALQNTDNNVERAVDWIFSHMEEINNIPEQGDNSNCAAAMEGVVEDNKSTEFTDGPPSMSMTYDIIFQLNY